MLVTDRYRWPIMVNHCIYGFNSHFRTECTIISESVDMAIRCTFNRYKNEACMIFGGGGTPKS